MERSVVWQSEVALLQEQQKRKVDEIEKGEEKVAIEVGKLIANEVLEETYVHLTILKENYDALYINGEMRVLSGEWYDIDNVMAFLKESGFYPKKTDLTGPTIKWQGDVYLSETQPRMI